MHVFLRMVEKCTEKLLSRKFCEKGVSTGFIFKTETGNKEKKSDFFDAFECLPTPSVE
jgi:hypothetical protein